MGRSTVYKSIDYYGINYEQFSRMTQAEIDCKVEIMKNDHANIGEIMVQGHLNSRGLQVQ